MDKYAVFSRVNLNTPSLASLCGFLRHSPRWPKRDKGELLARFCVVALELFQSFVLRYLVIARVPNTKNYQLFSIRSHGPKKP